LDGLEEASNLIETDCKGNEADTHACGTDPTR
jgi:hypothetical protein